MPSSTAELDAVTLDAFGTLLDLRDPVPRLRDALAERGVARTAAQVADAFAAEVTFYVPRSHDGRDERTLADLRRECVRVFLESIDAKLDPDEFTPAFLAALRYRPIAGVPEALARLRSHGIALACVANWDYTLPEHLAACGLAASLDAVATSAEAGAPKPDPRVFRLALARLGAEPGRTLHVGDAPADREGAAAAGLAFQPVPVATLPERLGLG